MALSTRVMATEEDILLFDNFDDGNLNGWTIESGNWQVNNGNLAGSSSGKALGGRINTGNSEWDNYRIELDINGFLGIDQGVGFRYGENGSYEINLRYGKGIHNTPQIILWKIDGNGQTLLKEIKPFSLANNKWYHLIIEVSNENIKAWIDNTPIFDFTDTGTNIKKGTITLSYWTGIFGGAYMKFDNIKVSALAPSHPPRLPVIFIPGIGGSEMKASQDIFWSSDDGHGGTYSHAYGGEEKIWVNQDEAVKLGNDDYFDILRLKADGVTSEAALVLTGELTSFGYSDIDPFFTEMGYDKGTNFFVFPYDWRKDVRTTKDDLDALIENARQKSGQPQVNLVVHSMGGLVARYYISDAQKASKVNKLIELGVPHLGATSATKTLMYGSALQKNVFGIFPIGVPASEVKDVSRNNPALFQLLPSNQYYNFYTNLDKNLPYPLKDDQDIDNNNLTGTLNFDQTKNLLSNLNYNMSVFNFGEQFHNSLDSILNQTNGTKVYGIVGTAQPTLGQINETWWITWPINLFPKRDEIFINGDGTVPLYSASLKNDNLDISGATKIYYVEQNHGNLVSTNGTAMQTVKAILNDDNDLPVEVKDQKFILEGEQISLDDGELDLYDDQNRHCGLNEKGEIEENIPDVICTTSGNTKHAFVKKKAAKVKVKATRKKKAVSSKTTNIKKRTYREDRISKTAIYKDIAIDEKGGIEFDLDPSSDISPPLTIYPDSAQPESEIIIPTSEIQGGNAFDQSSPTTSIQISGTKDSSGIYTNPVTITLTGNDTESGILRIEYSLDNGQTVKIYSEPFIISAPGKTTIQIKAVDKSGNEEIPQTIIIEIAVPASPTPTPSPTPASTGTSSGNNNSSSGTTQETNQSNNPTSVLTASTSKESEPTFEVNKRVLGINFENPARISDQINVTNILGEQKKLSTKKKTINPASQILGGLLMVSGGIITLAFLGLITTIFQGKKLFFKRRLPFVKPFPQKM
ncbi:MAG: Esterase [uncultured bacterium]|nr:MAG: Esterase [uncultured bacterium]OGE21841.1 MAG: hypothetical protein A2778_02995 [Candidatus Daviesbacteria bacterium RIFCSPHIGHO2_01_FULL_40_24]OGE29890.1 MAG: hypothetical protein A3C29_02615 [Candidatus Daviesbacteria bacterium RIFCSPHIGHO2_02_FULL_40_16]OGE43316.1 MAG: hypothetical protein A3A53_01620 [Candidatus Daviesbacteria bacterium RIFCSPLOWO2_01_FULL_39_23]OGE67991.1 MAG: hypothetical protein A3J16_03685 [Candidatus Daviesbacteria bacterium RIFCSPLOWO2_02_FULL_39_13]